jgi:hypothetical protein
MCYRAKKDVAEIASVAVAGHTKLILVEKESEMAVEHTFLSAGGLVTKSLTAMKAIRFKCLECAGFQSGEVRKCHIEDCALWPFRFGRYPQKNEADSGFEDECQ